MYIRYAVPPYSVGTVSITIVYGGWVKSLVLFLARGVFVTTNRHAIAMMFVRLSVWDGRAL